MPFNHNISVLVRQSLDSGEQSLQSTATQPGMRLLKYESVGPTSRISHRRSHRDDHQHSSFEQPRPPAWRNGHVWADDFQCCIWFAVITMWASYSCSNVISTGVNIVLCLMGLRQSFRRSRWLGIYTCTLFALATAGITLQILWHQFVFLESHERDERPLEFMEDSSQHPENLAITAM